ncbi:hypothetical protein HW555_002274, partial [Spodoptera exigua]
ESDSGRMDSLYERAIAEVGQEGKFQITFDIFYNVLLSGLWSMAYNNIILALTITPHICKLPQKPTNVTEYYWKSKYIPTLEDAVGAKKFSDCLIYTSQELNKTKECEIFDYDRTWFESTIPSENNWVCSNEINVANIFAYSKIGEIIGSFVFGWYGDVYGRRLTYIISLAMLVIGRFMSILASSSFVLFATGCIIASLPSWSATQSTAIVSLEISSPKRRASVAKLRLISMSLGMKLIESPQWLWVNRKTKDCIKNLKRIAKVNKTKLSSATEEEILTSGVAEANETEVLGPLALFSGWRLATNTILQLVCISINYTVVLLSSAEKSNGNPFLDFAWQSLAEIPGFFIASWLANNIGRRYTGVISTAITACIWIFYDVADWLNRQWLGSSLVFINRLTITISYYIINLFNMELYPTCLRQTGMSLGNVVSGGAGAIAPYILVVVIVHIIRVLILIITTIFGGILTSFFLPETLNAKLPETFEDAQRFGRRRRNRTFYMSVNLKNETIDSNLPNM